MKKENLKKEPQTLEQQNAARQLQLDHLRESDKIMIKNPDWYCSCQLYR